MAGMSRVGTALTHSLLRCIPFADHVLGTSFMGAGSKPPGLAATIAGGSSEICTGELDPNLKYDTSGSTPIVLIPQPSNDPNDPLVGWLSGWYGIRAVLIEGDGGGDRIGRCGSEI